ncbi:unnamed protein product [Phytophthora lilii]|uniref:Unnamed protein product n=1 Tax=Phytophthora lilii TaxID=2077276 RepID=A0A9W6TL11_9STRA|nr:unnamed protein product [Phytophthora lilii]
MHEIFSKLAAHLKVEPTAVLGHSFGGKVALTYLQQCMQQDRAPPSQVWVLDSLPGTGTDDPHTILPVVKKIPLPIRSKAQLVKDLQGYGIALGEAQWLTTNLRLTSKSPELYEWKMDVDVIEQLFRSFLATDLWPVVENPPATEGKDVELHFVHASKNNMWTPELLDRLDAQQENQVYHHLLEKSGHWVHIDNPVGLMKLIETYMLQLDVCIAEKIAKRRQSIVAPRNDAHAAAARAARPPRRRRARAAAIAAPVPGRSADSVPPDRPSPGVSAVHGADEGAVRLLPADRQGRDAAGLQRRQNVRETLRPGRSCNLQQSVSEL